MFFKITPSEPPIPFSLFTFLQKGTKPKCLLRKRYPEARVPLESIFPPPPQGPIPAAGLGRQSEGSGEAAARRGTNSGTKAQGTGNLTEVGERRARHRPRQPAQLQAAGVAPAGGLRRQLGLQRAGPGPGCLFAQAHVAAVVAAQNRLEGTRAGALAPRGPLREAGGRLARRARLRVSQRGKRKQRAEAWAWGGGRAPRGQLGSLCAQGHLLLLSRGLLLEHLLCSHDLLALGDQVALLAGALLPAALARVALDWYQEAMVPAPRALGGTKHLLGLICKVCIHSTTVSSESFRDSETERSSPPKSLVLGALDTLVTRWCSVRPRSCSKTLAFSLFFGAKFGEVLCLG